MSVELLFFDTFAHDNSEELNLDLVQFPKPVYVTEVRIIPLGARVQADFPGGVRLGATNPSQFQIEFFVNDLGKPGASTFESLGGFEYNQNGCINLECVPNESVRKIPTDGLVLRGWYTTITLAVYGTLTVNISEQIIPPVVTPSLPAQANTISDVQQIITSHTIENEWPQENIQTVPIDYTQQSAAPYSQTYPQPEPYTQEYTEYYNEVPKDPRNYHHTSESEWDNKSRGRSIEHDRERDRGRDIPYQKPSTIDHDHDRERRYSRSHSGDRERSRDYRESSRDKDRDRDWEHDRSQNRDYRSDKDWDRDRYKHQDYHRSYTREDRDDARKRPRTPPPSSPKRPHTPHSDHKELSPPEIESVSEDENNLEKQRKERETQSPDVKEARSPSNEEVMQMDLEEFEPILSDEDIVDDSEHFQDVDYDYTAYTNNDEFIKLFVPGSTELHKYQKTKIFVVENDHLQVEENFTVTIGIIDDFFKSSITKYTLAGFDKLNTEIKEEFVHLCEKITTTVDEIDHFRGIISLYCYKKKTLLNDNYKEIMGQINFITETLIEWLKIAMNFDMANAQDQPAYKIRHIKCGIRIAEWCCNSSLLIDVLWEQDYFIDEILMQLYNQEYMALSIKLMILKALDAYLQKDNTIRKFIQDKPFTNPAVNNFNGYKLLVKTLMQNPSVRLKFSVSSILKKLNLYEILQLFAKTVLKLRDTEKKSNDLKSVIEALEYIAAQMCQADPFLLSQPKRFLPVSSQFEINRACLKNPLMNLFEMNNLLGILTFLLTYPETMNLSAIKTPIFEIISELLNTSDGLQFLSSNIENTNLLLKCLLQEDEIQFSYSLEAKSHHLGLMLAYKMQSLYQIAFLLDSGEKFDYDCDCGEIIDHLHAFYCLTFSNVGKVACADVLTMDDNFKSLIQFIDINEKSEGDLSKLKKSPGISYIIDLISLTIIYTPNSLSLFENYSKQLLHLINHHEAFETSISIKITEFASFIKPFEHINIFNYDNVNVIVEIISKNADATTNYPGQLITGLRILQRLGIPKRCCDNLLNSHIELKYKHVILQLFSYDGVALITKILQKVCDFYEQPSLHTSTFVSSQGVYIVNTIEPCVLLLKQMLTYVIQCRNTNFKDLTTVPVLLQTYHLLYTFPTASTLYFKTRMICEDLIATLLVYTQPISDEVNEKDSLNKTLWTMMCGEVFKYITMAPYTFIPGLLIFSELLPLPLPVPTQVEMTSDEILWTTNLRKLWSAHLHAHSGTIQELINKLCVSSHQPLLNLLRRVCVQLSDLAANSAIVVGRGVLDIIHKVLQDDGKCNGHVSRVLNFLACLVTHSSLKCAVLQLLNANNVSPVKGDEKYPQLITAFAQVLKNSNNSNSHIQSQECILSIIQSFCDTEITLLQNSPNEKSLNSEVYLANALPTKENLLIFISMMMEHLMSDNSFVTYLPIVRTLLLLTEHDYGFYHLKECLSKRTEPFSNVLMKLVKDFSKDNAECLSTLNTLVEFLRVCAVPEEVEGPTLFTPRTMKMSLSEIRTLVGWKNAEVNTHPIYELESILKKTIQEDKTFESLLEGLQGFINLLNSDTESDAKDSYNESTLPSPDTLLVQFVGRPVFAVTEGTSDDRLTSVFWLSVPSDEAENDLENVSCDIVEISRSDLPQEVNLVREVEKLCRVCSSDNLEQDDLKIKVASQKDKSKKPFVTPMARRGFPRTINQRTDLFRSRPPNTSRPPSLHVDDFVALETCGAQPTGPTGYNKISRELLATSRVARGPRGRAFVTSERAVQYRQMSWWGTGLSRGPYQ